MVDSITIAGVQMDVAIGQPEQNRGRIVQWVRQAAAQGAKLVVFPECAIPGYCFDSLEEAHPFGEPIPGPSTDRLAAMCAELGVHVVTGLLESDGPRLFNTCVLIGPSGLVGSYRKVHLPFLGVDRFTTPGDRPFEVFDLGNLKVAMHICYDAAFPEAARSMALLGADLIVLPTNWPPGSELVAEHVICTRALENNVYFVAVNRVGSERGFSFIGRSKICAPDGRILSQAGPGGETILYAQVAPSLARQKHLVRVPGKHEIDRFNDRRPEMYRQLVAAPAPTSLDSKGQ